ncbi:hypothetical protein Vadar_031971 [Vaccinium darrowii]|uniref:Uncharacterized protein n=1 Tax=Vaccinium darrowii TaxID=229202 RepID=A0ACB7X5N0_9ERIC|nr:hypothetical protein Vadar_031971 [Vaccinium darrowii]
MSGTGKSLEPYMANDVHLQFYMTSPYVLKTLSTDQKGLYFIAFRVPDVYGVFQFKVEYQLGYTIFSLSKQILEIWGAEGRELNQAKNVMLLYSVQIYEWSGKSWEPYVANDVQHHHHINVTWGIGRGDPPAAINSREAGRSSMLSHRWRNLWKLTTSLNFDESETMWKMIRKPRESSKYIAWVNQVLKLHFHPSLDEFRVNYFLDGSDSCDIDEWINFAIPKRVKVL